MIATDVPGQPNEVTVQLVCKIGGVHLRTFCLATAAPPAPQPLALHPQNLVALQNQTPELDDQILAREAPASRR